MMFDVGGATKDQEALEKELKKSELPKKLTDFLKKELGKNLPSNENRRLANEHARDRKFIIKDKDIVKAFTWRSVKEGKGVSAISIRDARGRFKSWFIISGKKKVKK